MSWKNPIKQKLARGEIVVGPTLTVPSPEIAARLASVGYDFLWIELEHSPISLETLRSMVLATRGLPALPLARVPVVERWWAKRVLDCGVHGVIFPFTSNASLAEVAARSVRYPPAGNRGSGAGLARLTWPETQSSYYDSADENLLAITVVEDEAGLENIESIAAVPGIDVIFIGVSDLSFSLGKRGDDEHPTVRKAIQKISAAARKERKYLGRPAWTASEIKKFRRQGFQFFQAQTELGLMEDAARQVLGKL